ncbi:MAG: phosphonate ABC transporter, permease protein PhnE [Halothece sp.]
MKERYWSPPRLIANPWLRWGLLLGIVIYLGLAVSSLEVDMERVARGIPRSMRLFAGVLQPDFVSRGRDIVEGILESLTMTVISTFVGVLLSLPVALGSARNLSPVPIYLLCRSIVTLSRTFQEVMIAILFVVMVGFGPLAGVLTLSFTSIGFLAKLLSEDIEEIDHAQLEAMQATGGSWLQIITYGVIPQVTPRFVGLSAYRFDINLRESTVVGVVGAGGIGDTLQTSFSRYDYSTSAAILIVIIVLVLATEVVSSWIRKRLQ